MAGHVNKKERAIMQVMADMGEKPKRIGRLMGRSPHTIAAHLQKECDDPEVKEMIEAIKQHELQQLHTIGFKARTILGNYLDAVLAGDKEPNPISVTAILDRTFTQRRLIEGLSTENYSIAGTLSKIDARINELQNKVTNEQDDEV